MHKRILAGSILVGIIGIASVVSGAGGTADDIPPGDIEQLAATAQHFSELNGMDSPASAQAVESTRSKALEAAQGSSAGIDSEDPVYVVEITGDFAGNMAKIPAGATIPEGQAIVIILSTSDMKVMDWGILETSFDLTELGTPADLPVR